MVALEGLTGSLWTTILIGVDLVVCGLVLAYLLRARHDEKRLDPNRVRQMIDSLSELIRTSERASKDFLDELNERQRGTRELLDRMEVSEKRVTEVIRHAEKLLMKPRSPGPALGYEEVSRLADMGLSTEEISERVKLPKGEIELVLGLKR